METGELLLNAGVIDMRLGSPGIKSGWGRLNLYRLLSAPKATNRYARVQILVKDATGAALDGPDTLL